MPLPFIIGGIALAAGAAGVKSGISGGVKIKDAKETMEIAKKIQEKAVEKLEKKTDSTSRLIESISNEELKIQKSFASFSNIIEKIQNRPEFKAYQNKMIDIHQYELEKISDVSVGRTVLLGEVVGSSVSATLIAQGAASVGAGALAITPGIGLLAGGLIMNSTGKKLSNEADEAYRQAKKTEEEVEEVCKYLNSLTYYGSNFKKSLLSVNGEYGKRLNKLDMIVNCEGKIDWNDFTEQEKLLTQNSVLLVGILYKMCQVKLVKKTDNESREEVNKEEINKAIKRADEVIKNDLLEDVA